MRGQWKAKSTEIRRCETCSRILERRRNAAGRLEGFRNFMRRRFCSLSCANSRRKGGETRNAYLYHARKYAKPSCEACGLTQDLQVHHVDTNWRNNSPLNLQTLCLFCHHFWHATHERLGVTPTTRMPKLSILSPTVPGTALADCAPTATRSSRKPRRPSSTPIST